MADTPPKLTYGHPSLFHEGEDAALAVRIQKPATSPGAQGTAFIKTEIDTITLTLYRIWRGTTLIVEDYNAVSIDKDDVFYDALQGWPRDTYGFNFRHVIDETDLDPVATYKAVYDFELTNNESFTVTCKFDYLGAIDEGLIPGELPDNNGEDGADGLSVLWRGEWDSGTAYAIQNLVRHNNNGYIAVAVNSASEPPNANWELAWEGGAGSGSSAVTAQFIQTATVTVSNTTTETTVVSTSGALGSLPIATGTFLAGDQEYITAWGVYSTKDTGAGTLTVELAFGTEIVATFDAVELNGAQDSVPWDAWLRITRRSEGTSGVVSGFGQLTIGRTNLPSIEVPISIAPTVLPSDASKTPAATGKWSVASADNSFVCYGVNTEKFGGPEE